MYLVLIFTNLLTKIENMTNIKSVVTPSETSSPFYQKNKSVCEEWEKFILSLSGEIRGKYSAWAFILKAKITVAATEWHFNINKSTMTNAFLIGKKDVHHFTDIETINPNLFKTSFTIRPKKYLDFFWKKWTADYTALNGNLVLIKPKSKDENFDKLIIKLKILAENSLIREISYHQSNGVFSLKLGSVLEDWEFLVFLMGLKK